MKVEMIPGAKYVGLCGPGDRNVYKYKGPKLTLKSHEIYKNLKLKFAWGPRWKWINFFYVVSRMKQVKGIQAYSLPCDSAFFNINQNRNREKARNVDSDREEEDFK